MAEANCTRKCLHCEAPIPAQKQRGRPRKHCSDECRAAHSEKVLRKQAAGKPECQVDGCSQPSRTKGWCSKHYARWRAHGDPLYTKHGKRVRKECAWCGQEMQLLPAKAKKRTTCSWTCAQRLRNSQAGTSRFKVIYCLGCHHKVERQVRTDGDSGKYCSRECAFSVKAKVSAETAAIQDMGRRQRERAATWYATIVGSELKALSRIAINIRASIAECGYCGKSHVRRFAFSRYCSEPCSMAHKAEAAERYRQSDAYKAMRRRHRARRRALERTAVADNIDPFAVFERDKWRCHLCGGKTLKSKRGTTHDRAPELEHIIALADGGTHTWGNVACACRKCNMTKGASSAGQLGLQIAC